MALFFLPLDVHEKGSACAHYKLAARFGYCSSARKMVPPDQIRFEPPGGVAGELWPFVVAYAFAFRIMTFVSDHMPLCRSEGT
jgi:hypothetical protein